MVMPGIPPGSNRGPDELSLAGLRLLIPTRLALGLDYLDRRWRRLKKRLEMRLDLLRLGLLLLLAVRAILRSILRSTTRRQVSGGRLSPVHLIWPVKHA
jgi:hypothetical protein